MGGRWSPVLARDPDWIAVGGLSQPSKMPGYGYGLPADECHTGGKLRKVEGSTCRSCYAMRGHYRYKNVQDAEYRRLHALTTDLEAWTSAMVRIIPKCVPLWEPVFRWHDSGDIQSANHLAAICQIAIALPMVRFWLPTREYAMVRDYCLAGLPVPSNLTIRLSAPMVGRPAMLSDETRALGIQSSTVGAHSGYICEAKSRGNECGPCRACWSKDVPNVDYPLH